MQSVQVMQKLKIQTFLNTRYKKGGEEKICLLRNVSLVLHLGVLAEAGVHVDEDPRSVETFLNLDKRA